MARPRKDDPNAHARERLIEAFWKLIEVNQLHEITVSMIVGTAHCSRNAFYYHFENKDALVEAAIDNELKGVPHNIFMLLSSGKDAEQELKNAAGSIARYARSHFSGKEDLDGNARSGRFLYRLALFMEQGGRNIVEMRVKGYILNMWTTLLAPENGTLQGESRIILEHGTSGMLGLIACIGKMSDSELNAFPVQYLQGLSTLILDNICRIQNISKEEVFVRLSVLHQMSKAQE